MLTLEILYLDAISKTQKPAAKLAAKAFAISLLGGWGPNKVRITSNKAKLSINSFCSVANYSVLNFFPF
jgi:hypothetical protein